MKSQKSGIWAGAQSQGTKLPCGARIGIIGNMSYFLSLMILPLLSFFSLPRKKYNWDQCHSENKLNSIRGGLTSVNLHGPGKIQVFVRWAKVNANNLLIFKVQGWGLWVKIILCNQNPINPLESINQEHDHPLFYTRLPVFPFWFFCTLSKMEMKPRRQSGDRLWSCETLRERESWEGCDGNFYVSDTGLLQ